MDGAPAYGHIVVGVDGSPTSRAALLWAAREAELRRCPLDVVYGWQVKSEPRPPGEWGGVAPPVEAYQDQAQVRIQAIVDEVLPDGAKCELRVHAVHKPAGRALLSFCDGTDLLVVGAKERGRLASWLVGSASDDAVKKASCTVVVVRPPVGDTSAQDEPGTGGSAADGPDASIPDAPDGSAGGGPGEVGEDAAGGPVRTGPAAVGPDGTAAVGPGGSAAGGPGGSAAGGPGGSAAGRPGGSAAGGSGSGGDEEDAG